MGMTGITTIRLPSGEYRHACTRSKDGRRPAEVGCRHLSPRSAIAHSTNLDHISRLRVSGDGSTPISTPQPGSGQLEPSPDARERVSRVGGSGR